MHRSVFQVRGTPKAAGSDAQGRAGQGSPASGRLWRHRPACSASSLRSLVPSSFASGKASMSGSSAKPAPDGDLGPGLPGLFGPSVVVYSRTSTEPQRRTDGLYGPDIAPVPFRLNRVRLQQVEAYANWDSQASALGKQLEPSQQQSSPRERTRVGTCVSNFVAWQQYMTEDASPTAHVFKGMRRATARTRCLPPHTQRHPLAHHLGFLWVSWGSPSQPPSCSPAV